MSKFNPYRQKEKIQEIRVNEKSKLMNFLLANMGGTSRNKVKSLLRYRQVSINGRVTSQFDAELKPDDMVSINTTRGNTELNHPLLSIIYEDEEFIVVNKKEGLLTVTVGTGRDITAFSILKNYVKKQSPINKIYTVHRIDKFTSGLVLFSKNRDLQHLLRNNWHELVTLRSYVAVVEGEVEKKSGQIISWLTEHKVEQRAISSPHDNGGKKAITNYRVIKTKNNYTLMELELVTGRKNQIRVHMEDIGHPIIGDRKYGPGEQFSRLALHAHKLEFTHPVSGKTMRFKSEIPKEFSRLFR